MSVPPVRGRADAGQLPRPADPQGAGLDLGDPDLLLLRRHGRQLGRAGLRDAPARGGGGRAPGLADGAGRAVDQPGAADLRSRPPGALSQHAADVQDHLADERRDLGGVGHRRRHRTGHAGRSRRVAAGPISASPRSDRAAAVARPVAALGGLSVATYTAALLVNTAVPAWHEARWTLPMVFASGAALSAGGACTAFTPTRPRGTGTAPGPDRGGGRAGRTEVMHRRLGMHAETYRSGSAARLGALSRASIVAGAALLARGWRAPPGRGRRGRRAAVRRGDGHPLERVRGRPPVGGRPALRGRAPAGSARRPRMSAGKRPDMIVHSTVPYNAETPRGALAGALR